MAADFTFSLDRPATHEELRPLYSHVLSYREGRPTVSFGPDADPAAARQWLKDSHASYVEAVGKRSSLIHNIKLEEKVDLVDLKAVAP